jgi:uncharacterized protein (DUF2147 family)
MAARTLDATASLLRVMKRIALTAALATLFAVPPAFAADVPRPSEAAPAPLAATLPADTLLGEWWTEGREGKMRFVKTKSGAFEGIIVSGKDDDKKDVNNPNEKLRDRKLKGIVIMWHLQFVDGEYVDGYCYNPRDGNTYRVKIRMLGQNSLKLRGYLAIPLLGQSQEWERVQ